MAAYAIFIRNTPAHSAEGLTAYQTMNRENVGAYLAHGIKPLVRYGAITPLEGCAPDGIVILEFPTLKAAQNWYDSPEYQTALPLRLAASDYTAFIVEGL